MNSACSGANSTTDSTPTTAAARVPDTLQWRSSTPKVAQNRPAVANNRSPRDAFAAEGGERFGAEHHQAADDGGAAYDAGQRGALAQQQCRENDAEQGGAGRLDGGAVAERHQDEAGIGHDGLRRAGEHRHRQPAPPADAAEADDALAHGDGHQEQPRPEKAVKGQIVGREADIDAVLGRDEAGCPPERRAGAAQDADHQTGAGRRSLTGRVQGGFPQPLRR